MVISYAGGECFKVSQGDLTIAFNPPAKDSKLASSKFGADIALVRGFGGATEYGGTKTINTIYSVAVEGMNLCFLGALGSAELPASAKQELDDIGVLFLPVGGKEVLDHAAAYKLAVGLGPKVIIPMHYDAGSLKAFLKEAGAEGTKAEERLTIKKKDLDGKEAEVVVLQA